MKQITIYTTQFCPFCIQAKRLLNSNNLQFKEIPLDRDPEKRLQLSRENNGWRTVPMIFFGSEFVGGYQELKELSDRNLLQSRLA